VRQRFKHTDYRCEFRQEESWRVKRWNWRHSIRLDSSLFRKTPDHHPPKIEPISQEMHMKITLLSQDIKLSNFRLGLTAQAWQRKLQFRLSEKERRKRNGRNSPDVIRSRWNGASERQNERPSGHGVHLPGGFEFGDEASVGLTVRVVQGDFVNVWCLCYAISSPTGCL
jgi:hypothetical protein